MDRRAFIAGAAALALAPRGLAEIEAGREVALVTADLESRLVAVDLETGRVHRYVPTLPRPRSIETVGSRAVVAHSEIGVVTIVRSSSLSVAHVLRGFGEPRYTAGHPDGRHAYVSDAKRGEVVVLDVITGRVLGSVPVGPHRASHHDRPVGPHALGRAGPEGRGGRGRRCSPPRPAPARRRFRPPFLAHDVGFAPGGRHAWVSSGAVNEVALYSARTGRLVARIPADEPPQHFTFKGARVYHASGESGTLRVHAADGRLLRLTRIPDESYNVQQGRGWVVTPGLGTGTLCVLDSRGRILRTGKIARSSHDACVVLAAT